MIIDTDQYYTVAEFAKKIGKIPQCIRHYIEKKQVEVIDCKGLCLITKASADKFKVGKQGRRKQSEEK